MGDYMKVIRSGTTIKYYHIKAIDGALAKGTLLYTSSKASNANTKLFLDSSFCDVGAKLSNMQIFSSNNLPFSVDVLRLCWRCKVRCLWRVRHRWL
jgi:hypothetical protein